MPENEDETAGTPGRSADPASAVSAAARDSSETSSDGDGQMSPTSEMNTYFFLNDRLEHSEVNDVIFESILRMQDPNIRRQIQHMMDTIAVVDEEDEDEEDSDYVPNGLGATEDEEEDDDDDDDDDEDEFGENYNIDMRNPDLLHLTVENAHTDEDYNPDMLDEDEEDDEDSEEDISGTAFRKFSQTALLAAHSSTLQQVPNPHIVELVEAGEFGPQPPLAPYLPNAVLSARTTSLSLLQRKISRYRPPLTDVTKRYLPNNSGHMVKRFPAPAYGGRFSADGSLFYVYTQEFMVHVFSTENVTRPKQIASFHSGSPDIMPLNSQWTITDADMSKDNQWLVHCTRSPILSLSKVDTSHETSTQVIIADESDINKDIYFSVRFSDDAKHLVVGSQSNIVKVYDIEHDKSQKFSAEHMDDINSVRFLDTSGNVVISGSDDSTIRLWDRRSNECIGGLVGHLEGITCVETRGDGRYILSNGKDQTMKLWDIRKLLPGSVDVNLTRFRSGYRYQRSQYNGSKYKQHPHDKSVMTYRGHEVQKTAIRCNFSPAESTGQQYVYSGSSHGNIYIWKLDGTLVRILQARSTARNHASNFNIYGQTDTGLHQNSHFSIRCVRECSWHPTQPVIYSPCFADFDDYEIDYECGGLAIYSRGHGQLGDPSGEFDYRHGRVPDDLIDVNKKFSL